MEEEIFNNFAEAVNKIEALETRLRDLICYTEYIASNLDFTVDYAEFISKQIPSCKFNLSDMVPNECNPGHRTPSFKQFKKMRMVA